MWSRVAKTSFQTVAAAAGRRSAAIRRTDGDAVFRAAAASRTPVPFSRAFSADSGTNLSKEKKGVEDILPIVTGHEREELEAELTGKKRFNMDAPSGPFGTEESPAIVHSYYDKRIVGCPGGLGEDEHDVIWFWLKKGVPFKCPICNQHFKLEVIGEGGSPDGHDDDDGH